METGAKAPAVEEIGARAPALKIGAKALAVEIWAKPPAVEIGAKAPGAAPTLAGTGEAGTGLRWCHLSIWQCHLSI